MIKIKLKGKKMKFCGALVLVLNSKNEVLIIKRTPGDYWAAGLWAYPGGKPDPGETPEQTAVRETKEETNLEVTDLKELKLKIDKPVATYYTRSYSGDVKIDWEHTDWAWVDKNTIGVYDLAPNTLEMYDWVLKHG